MIDEMVNQTVNREIARELLIEEFGQVSEARLEFLFNAADKNPWNIIPMLRLLQISGVEIPK